MGAAHRPWNPGPTCGVRRGVGSGASGNSQEGRSCKLKQWLVFSELCWPRSRGMGLTLPWKTPGEREGSGKGSQANAKRERRKEKSA